MSQSKTMVMLWVTFAAMLACVLSAPLPDPIDTKWTTVPPREQQRLYMEELKEKGVKNTNTLTDKDTVITDPKNGLQDDEHSNDSDNYDDGSGEDDVLFAASGEGKMGLSETNKVASTQETHKDNSDMDIINTDYDGDEIGDSGGHSRGQPVVTSDPGSATQLDFEDFTTDEAETQITSQNASLWEKNETSLEPRHKSYISTTQSESFITPTLHDNIHGSGSDSSTNPGTAASVMTTEVVPIGSGDTYDKDLGFPKNVAEAFNETGDDGFLPPTLQPSLSPSTAKPQTSPVTHTHPQHVSTTPKVLSSVKVTPAKHPVTVVSTDDKGDNSENAVDGVLGEGSGDIGDDLYSTGVSRTTMAPTTMAPTTVTESKSAPLVPMLIPRKNKVMSAPKKALEERQKEDKTLKPTQAEKLDTLPTDKISETTEMFQLTTTARSLLEMDANDTVKKDSDDQSLTAQPGHAKTSTVDLKQAPPDTGGSTLSGLSMAVKTGVAVACLVGFLLLLAPITCIVIWLKDRHKRKEEKTAAAAGGAGGQSQEDAEPALRENLITATEPTKQPNGDIANGKDKEYKIEIKDTSEVQKLNLENGTNNVKDTAV